MTQICEGLNLSSTTTPQANFFPQDGVFFLDWDGAYPRHYLDKAKMSKLTWEIIVRKNKEVAPNNNIIVNPVIKLVTKDGTTINTVILEKELKGAKKIYIWLRTKYTFQVLKREQNIALAMWSVANVVTVDNKLVSRFSSLFTLRKKLILALNERSIQANWISVVPDSVLQASYMKTEFQHLDNIQWEVVVSLSNNLEDVGVTQDLLVITKTQIENPNTRFSKLGAVFVLIHVVLDVGIGGISSFKDLWAMRDPSIYLSLSTLDSGQSLILREYLSYFFRSNQLEKNHFILQSDGNFVLYHISNGGQSTQAI